MTNQRRWLREILSMTSFEVEKRDLMQSASTCTLRSWWPLSDIFELSALFQGCDCNGHADTCDVETGTCECLTRWVTGEHCER